MKRELNIFVLRTALFAAPILLLFELLYHFGYYPIITDSSLFDRKVNLVRNRRLQRVDLMAMGSSVTLYDLNSREMVTAFDKPYYNFSSVNLQCTDIRILLRQFAKEYKPEYIVTCSSIREFIHPRDSTYLNYTNTNKFIRDHFPEYFYFHKYSSLYRLIWRKNKLSPLIIDEWGGASWTVPKADMIAANGNEHEIFPTEYTEMQYRELDSLAAWLANQKIRLIFAQTPIKASYANTPAAKQLLRSHFERCRSIVETHGGTYLNYDDPAVFADSLFFDQYHLQADGALLFTKKLVTDLKGIIK